MNDSSHPTGTLVQVLRIHVLSSHPEWAAAFLHAVAPTAIDIGSASVDVAGQPFDLTIPETGEGGGQVVPSPDAAVLTARFLDGGSLKILKAHLDGLVGSPPVPVVFALLRNEGESEFKISCCGCGQKLWVRDPDEGKRGRCPNCRKAFQLPSQASYLRAALQLSEATPIRRVTLGHAGDSRQVLTALAPLLIAPVPAAAREPADDATDPVSRIPEVPRTDTDVVEPIDDGCSG